MGTNWRIGITPDGQKWLVKMTGSLHGHRERVYATLAQALGISCQSSTFVILDPKRVGIRQNIEFFEAQQLAIWLMDEHPIKPCSPTCPLSNIYGKKVSFEDIKRSSKSGVAHIEDIVRGDVLGRLCGQSEPHGHFFNRLHQYVVIDNECTFVTSPSLRECRWVDEARAQPLIIQVCRGLADIPDENLRSMADIPNGYAVKSDRDLGAALLLAKSAAIEYLSVFS
jgi:hypothetical protein